MPSEHTDKESTLSKEQMKDIAILQDRLDGFNDGRPYPCNNSYCEGEGCYRQCEAGCGGFLHRGFQCKNCRGCYECCLSTQCGIELFTGIVKNDIYWTPERIAESENGWNERRLALQKELQAIEKGDE